MDCPFCKITAKELDAKILSEKETASMLAKALKATGFNIVNANGKSAQQSVFHLHFQIVPRFDNDGRHLWFHGDKKISRTSDQVYTAIIKHLENGNEKGA